MRHQRNRRKNGRPRSIPRPSAIAPGALRKLGAVAIGLAMAWSLLILYAVHIELGVNALDLPFESTIKPPLQAVIPEGWGFFTRDPREARLLPFRNESGVWLAANEGPNGEPWNALGFNRAARAQGVELGVIETAIPSEAWKPCSAEIADCFDKLSTPTTVTNPIPNPTLCGDVGLAKRNVLPWAWASSVSDETGMPSNVVRLKITC
jgi:antimicrobial peptide system SdpA family protein